MGESVLVIIRKMSSFENEDFDLAEVWADFEGKAVVHSTLALTKDLIHHCIVLDMLSIQIALLEVFSVVDKGSENRV